MLSMDSAVGKCCITGTTDDCLKDQFYCSNKVSTSFTFNKYAFCSFNATICGASQRNLKAKEVQQQVSTGLEFLNNDVCPYILISDTALPFNTNVELKVEEALNVDFYVLTGTSMDSIKTQQRVQSGSVITFDAGTIAYIVIKGTYAQPYAQFSFKNVQKLSNASWIGIIIGSSFGYFLLLMITLIIVTRKLTLRRLRQLQSPNIVYFLKKKVIQYMLNKKVSGMMKNDYTQLPKVGIQDYNKVYNGDGVKAIDLGRLQEPQIDHFLDNGGRQDTHIDRMQSARTGVSMVPPTAATNIPTAKTNQVERPKVQIRPYKFDFELMDGGYKFFLTYSVFTLLINYSRQYTITPNCNACLSSTSPSNKYCLPYEDSATGYCCDLSSSTDFCSQSSRYLCTDVVQSKSMKLYLCPNTQSKCFSTSTSLDYDQNTYSKVIRVGDQAQQVGGSTLEFGKDDICSWRIIADSQYVQDKFIRISINTLYQTNCFINAGTSIRSTTSEVSCASGTQYDFDADKSVFIILQGASAGATMQFTYQLVDRLDFKYVAVIYSVAVSVFIILAAVIAILTVRFVVQLTIRKNQQTWQAMAYEMKHIVDNAQKQKELQKIGPVEDMDGIYLRTVEPTPSREQIRRPSVFSNNLGQNKNWNDPVQHGPQGQNPSTANNAQFNLY